MGSLRFESSVRTLAGMLPAALGIGAAAFLLLFSGSVPAGLRLALKPIPVLCMTYWVVSTPRVRHSGYRAAVAAGLLFGAAGDVLLELGREGFVFGLAAFLIGHLFYLIAFLRDCRRPALSAAAASACYGAFAFGFLYRYGELGDLIWPVALYVAAICAMVWRAWARLGAPGVSRASFLAAFGGALLFTASDTLLAVNRFVAPFAGAGFLVLATYWLGQLGIAGSVLPDFSPRKPKPGAFAPSDRRDPG